MRVRWWTVGLLAVLGCTPLRGATPDADGSDASIDGIVPTEDAVPGADSTDVPEVPAAEPCARFVRGPRMILVDDSLCVDSTEVTQAQYAAFLADVPAHPPAQSAECAAWNSSFGPATFCPLNPSIYPTYPVSGVDWCDGAAFCQWAGKRLCGPIGASGATLVTTKALTVQDATVSEWSKACTKDGMFKYPYASATLKPLACNGQERGGIRATTPVASSADCVGGVPGIFDLAGNLYEWEAACDAITPNAAGHLDLCWLRGGSYRDSDNSCFTAIMTTRDHTDPDCDIGIRCCADPAAPGP